MTEGNQANAVISMQVLPFQSADLCFEVSGIMSTTASYNAAWLGRAVKAFDFDGFYAKLRAFTTNGGDASRLWYDSTRILSELITLDANNLSFAIAGLRNEQMTIALDKAIGERQNAFLAKYNNQDVMIAEFNKLYSPESTTSKLQRLQELIYLSENQFKALDGLYTAEGRTDVVRETFSELLSRTDSIGTVEDANLSKSVSGGLSTQGGEEESGSTISSTGSSASNATAQQRQIVANTDYGYRHPSYENKAQYQRTQISLIDEYFQHYTAIWNIVHLDTVFKNELNSIDSDIYRLQLGVLNTLLMSPIDGRITALYKLPGEAVQAGEPVLRVEQESSIRVLAQLKYRGRIQVGYRAYFETNEFENNGLPGGVPTSLSGTISAARGSDEDDRWLIAIDCANETATGALIFPPGYQFDYDNTKLWIVPV